MNQNPRRLRRPEERVGQLTNADLPPPSFDSDAALVAALRAHDEAAYSHLIDLYYSPMLRLATTFVRTTDAAEDVIQETWLAVLSGIERFEGRSSFKTWLFRILVNRARKRGSRDARMVPVSVHDESSRPMWTSSSSEWSADAPLHESQLQSALEEAIATLPRTQQVVIKLRDIDGWSAEEVETSLGLTTGNQRVLLHRARTKVRHAISNVVYEDESRSDGAG